MKKEVSLLLDIADAFQKMSAKMKLLRLISLAKQEYDKYNYEESSKNLEEALSVDPNNPVALRGLGCMKQFQGDYQGAIQFFNKALEFSEKKEIEYSLLGMVYYLQDKLDDAIVQFNLAIDENEDYAPAYEGRNQAMLENHLKIIDLQESLKKYF